VRGSRASRHHQKAGDLTVDDDDLPAGVGELSCGDEAGQSCTNDDRVSVGQIASVR
jgi:hypothetical protein